MGRCGCCQDIYSEHKDFIRGGVTIEDFDDEVRPRHPKRRKKKSRPRSQTRSACWATEDGKHVYVMAGVEESAYGHDDLFYKHFGFYKNEVKTCCGCRVTKGWRRETERYMKIKERKWLQKTGGEFNVTRGQPIQRYRRWGGNFYNFTWEYDVPEYYEKVMAKDEEKRLYWRRMRERGY